MFIFQVQTVLSFLLLIGKNRCEANSSSLEAQPAGEPIIDHGLPLGRKEKSSTLHWDCQPDSHYIQEQISLTTKLLQSGDEFMRNQKNVSADETVLVLGKAGSGKTSLVQFLIDNDKLMSKQVDTNTGEYIFEDGERIGTSATESFTLYPELVSYNSTINFCDSPGFHDSRSSAHEIVSMNVMKSIMNKFKRAKILIIENHASLQYGVTKDSFINTLRFVNDFVVDIDKYRDHLAIIATKIPLTYKATDDINVVSGLVTDEMHIESIVSYLNHTEKSLTERLRFKKTKNEEEFFRKVIRVLQSLQFRNKEGKATRINIFRRPYMSGTPKTMSLLMKNKESLLQTILNLDSVEVRPNDFDYTLSNEAKMYLECILELTSDSYKNKINELSFKLTDYVHSRTQNYTSFQQVLSELIVLHGSLKNLSENLDKTTNYNEFFEMIQGFTLKHNISINYNHNERFHVLEKYEEMLSKFVDMSKIFIPSSWTVPIRHIVKYTEDEMGWYQTLNKLIDGLSGYETQRNKSELYKTIFHENSTSTNNLMELFMSVTGCDDFEKFMQARGNGKKSWEMELITENLLRDSNISCDSNGRLILRGFQVRLSEINSENLVRAYCNDVKLSQVALLAVDSVYLDEDTIDMFEGVNLFVAAPRWKVVGERRVVLSGKSGPNLSGNPYVDRSRDGKPGLPGHNGGSFFGIGLQFTNGENLWIESNGGKGGRGADGGKGDRGEDGKDGLQKVMELLESSQPLSLQHSVSYGYESSNLTRDILIDNPGPSTEFLMYEDNSCCRIGELNRTCLKVITEINVYRYDGDCGSYGTPGGVGGVAGIGGLPGDQKLVELGEQSNIHLKNLKGINGDYGIRGKFGDRGSNGIAITCFNLRGNVSKEKDRSYWKCFNSDTSLVTCAKEPSINATIGYSATGIKGPTAQNFVDFGYYQYHHALLHQEQSDNPIFHKIISDFNVALSNKKHTHNLNYLGKL